LENQYLLSLQYCLTFESLKAGQIKIANSAIDHTSFQTTKPLERQLPGSAPKPRACKTCAVEKAKRESSVKSNIAGQFLTIVHLLF
jgi:hypothetical protein